jgi:basic amino acid/polyamine antiporter, APA family
MGTTSGPTAPRHLRRALGTLEYFTLAFGSMIGVGWIVVMDDWLERGGPGGAALGFLLGGVLVWPIGIVYGRWTEETLTADSELAYTAGLFPNWGRFLVGWMMTLAYLVVCPYEAVAVGQLAAQIVPGLEQVPLYQVAGSTVYLPTLLLGLAVVGAITAINIVGVHHSSRLQNILTFGLLTTFVIFAALGLWRGEPANLHPMFSHEGTWGGVVSTLLVLQVVPYFLSGFESIPRCAEERAEDFQRSRFMGITLAALATGVFFYVAVIVVTAALWPWQQLTDERLATAVALHRAFGSETLVNLLLLGAVLSLVKVLNGCLLSAARVLFAMGRSDLLPSKFGQVHSRFLTPAVAVTTVGLLSAAGCFLGKSALVPISEVGSFAIAVGWFSASLAYACKPGKTPRAKRMLWGSAGAGVAGLLMAMKLVPFAPGGFTMWEYASLAAWMFLGSILWRRTRRAH